MSVKQVCQWTIIAKQPYLDQSLYHLVYYEVIFCPHAPILWGDYTQRYICYWWKEHVMCISKYWIAFIIENK